MLSALATTRSGVSKPRVRLEIVVALAKRMRMLLTMVVIVLGIFFLITCLISFWMDPPTKASQQRRHEVARTGVLADLRQSRTRTVRC